MKFMIVALFSLSLMLAKTYRTHRSMKLWKKHLYETENYIKIHYSATGMV